MASGLVCIVIGSIIVYLKLDRSRSNNTVIGCVIAYVSQGGCCANDVADPGIFQTRQQKASYYYLSTKNKIERLDGHLCEIVTVSVQETLYETSLYVNLFKRPVAMTLVMNSAFNKSSISPKNLFNRKYRCQLA